MPNLYLRHIRSARWRNMRRDMARLRNHRCERCGGGPPLHLHHKTYARLGRELISDLEVLCCECHQRADDERSYNGDDDFAKSIDEAYRVIRERKAAGGEGWEPR